VTREGIDEARAVLRGMLSGRREKPAGEAEPLLQSWEKRG